MTLIDLKAKVHQSRAPARKCFQAYIHRYRYVRYRDYLRHLNLSSRRLEFLPQVEDLIDWGNIPDDPIFQLVFPQPGMLSPEELRRTVSTWPLACSRCCLRQIAHLVSRRPIDFFRFLPFPIVFFHSLVSSSILFQRCLQQVARSGVSLIAKGFLSIQNTPSSQSVIPKNFQVIP